MIRKIYTLFLLTIMVLGFSACSEDKIEQGTVSYELTYPYMEVDGFLSIILPNEMTIVFNGTRMKTTIKRGKIFETNIISDESTEYLAMYSDLDGQLLYCELTPDEIKTLQETLPTYSFSNTHEEDSVAGLNAVKYTVSSEDSLAPMDAWFTEDLLIEKGAWFSSYGEVKGFPLIYDIERYGIFTHATAISFTEEEISDSVFTIEGDYEKVDFETYEKESKAIFDILVDW